MRSLTAADRDALNRALQQILHGSDKGRAAQVAAMAREDGWERAATFSAHVLQSAGLNLRPWDEAPADADPNGNDPADRFLARMIAAGLSRYEPDPIAVMEEQQKAVGAS